MRVITKGNLNHLMILIAISIFIVFSGCIDKSKESVNSSQSTAITNKSVESISIISSSNVSSLKSNKLPKLATINRINLGPYIISYNLEDVATYNIRKSGPSRLRQSDGEGPSFDLYSLEISDNQNLSKININIQKFLPNMDRKTTRIEKNIKNTLSNSGYEDITTNRRFFGGSGYRSGVLGVGKSDKYETIFLAVYWNSDHSLVTIIGNLPETAMNSFFESIRIEE